MTDPRTSADCLFCKIVRQEIPAKLVAETDTCVAFRDINPQAPVHILVIPRQHVSSLDAADDGGLMGEVMLLAARIAREERVAGTGYRVVINTGPDAGQSVGHVHAHVLGGRKMAWPPG